MSRCLFFSWRERSAGRAKAGFDSDRLLPVQPLRDGFLKLSDSETRKLVRQLQCGQARIGQGDHD